MLKITILSTASTTTLKLEGALIGPWVDELERCWHILGTSGRRAMCVDLASLTRVGPGGKELLGWMHQEGVALVSGDGVTRAIVDEAAQLALAQGQPTGQELGELAP